MPGTVVLVEFSHIASCRLRRAAPGKSLGEPGAGSERQAVFPIIVSLVFIKALMATGSRRVLGLLFGSLLIGLGGLAVPKAALAVYAIAQYGEPKYPADFKHFDYVNPDASRGGTLVLANPNRLTSFDKFNPFTQRGNPAPGLGFMFESLTTGSLDEVSTAYGLLADDISIAPDGLSATFHINAKARFSNGDPVTAEDVKYSFDTLKSPQAAAQYAVYFGQISRAVILDPLTIRFDFRERTREMPFIAGAIPVFSHKWGMKPDGSHVPFDQLAFQKPIASGPYLIEQYDNGRTITFKRDRHIGAMRCRCGWERSTSN